MTVLSRIYGVRPARPHPVRIQRDLSIPAADGVRLLANRYYPADLDRPPLVLMRSPYGRGSALDQMPALLAERGYQVLYQSLRGTAGSGGRFDGFTIDPADGDGLLAWLRRQPWYGDALATWGASYLGFTQWELAARDIPEWKIALIQDAPSNFAHSFMYPGGAFALGNALGWVQIVQTMLATRWSTARNLLGVFTGPRRLRRGTMTLPISRADLVTTGEQVPWFQEWITHAPDDPYWQRMDHRANLDRMPPAVHLQGGWYDFFLPSMLADHAALVASGRSMRLLVGPWGHGRGLYTRAGMRDALAALDAAFDAHRRPGQHRSQQRSDGPADHAADLNRHETTPEPTNPGRPAGPPAGLRFSIVAVARVMKPIDPEPCAVNRTESIAARSRGSFICWSGTPGGRGEPTWIGLDHASADC